MESPDLEPVDQVGKISADFDLADVDPIDFYGEDLDDGSLRRLDGILLPSLRPAPPQASGGSSRSSRGHPYRHGDQELVDRLAMNNFQGPEYNLFNEELIKYGRSVCAGWIKNGKMHRECTKRNRPVGEFPYDGSDQDREDLAVDTAVDGAVLFRRVAFLDRKWSPDRGAALTTFYIGACIHTYPNVYRRWYRQHRHWRRVNVQEELPDVNHWDGEIDRSELRMFLSDVMLTLRQQDERLYIALTMMADGYRQKEIAESLGCTTKAVERLLERGRKKFRGTLEKLGRRHD